MLTEAAAGMRHLHCLLLSRLRFLRSLNWQLVEHRLLAWRRSYGDWSQTTVDGMYHHRLTLCLSVLGWRDVNWLFGAEFPLVAQIIPQVCVTWVQLIQHGDSEKLDVSLLGLRNPGLSLEDFFWAIGEARIAYPERVASQGEATF